jgi:putative DNA base modification enzyme with NMAD domain
MGTSTAIDGNRLVYAMQIFEVLDFDDYFHDPRFAAKKPRRGGTWVERCGDNIYHRELGGWARAFTYYHRDADYIEKDTRHPRVFISDHFFYFGENAPAIPFEFDELIRRRQGCKYKYPAEVIERFIKWLECSYKPGVHGHPRHRELRSGEFEEQIVSMREPGPRRKERRSPRC